MNSALLSWNGRERLLLMECIKAVQSFDWAEICSRIAPVVQADGTVTPKMCEQTYRDIQVDCGGSANTDEYNVSAVTEAMTAVRKEWLLELSEDIGAKERRLKTLNSEVERLKTAAAAEAQAVSEGGATPAKKTKQKSPPAASSSSTVFVPGPGGGAVFVPGPGGGSTKFVPGPGGGSVMPSKPAPAPVFVPAPGGGTVFVPGPGGGVVRPKADGTVDALAAKGDTAAAKHMEEESDRQRRVRIAPLVKVLRLIHQNKHAIYFRNPVTDEEVDMDEYTSIIKQPMDLTTLRNRLEGGETDSAEELWEGLMLIVNNAMKFNEKDSDVHDKALKLRDFIAKEMESVVEVEKMIASSPHNTATRGRGPKTAASAAGRKGMDAPTKKRGRKDVADDDDDDDEQDDKRPRRGGRAAKDDDSAAARPKATGRGRGGRRKA